MENATLIGKMGNPYKKILGKGKATRQLGIQWNYDIKMNLKTYNIRVKK